MYLKDGSTNAIFSFSKETRPWGNYDLYADNKQCTVKILNVFRGECLSLQYHFKRDQLYIILDDDFMVEYSTLKVPHEIIEEKVDDTRIELFNNFLKQHIVIEYAKSGDVFGFERRIIHRVRYMGENDFGRILDIAFGFNDENDIVRIRDKYGRSCALK